MSSFPPDAATNPDLPHDSLGPQVIGICSAMLVLVTLAVAARFWIRLKLVKGGLGADDWLILVAWVLAVAFDLDPLNRMHINTTLVLVPITSSSRLIKTTRNKIWSWSTYI